PETFNTAILSSKYSSALSAKARATASVPPPASKGTINSTDPSGNDTSTLFSFELSPQATRKNTTKSDMTNTIKALILKYFFIILPPHYSFNDFILFNAIDCAPTTIA